MDGMSAERGVETKNRNERLLEPWLCQQDPLQDQVAEEPAHSVQRNRSRMGASATSMPRASSRGSLPGMRGRERPNGSPAYDPFMFQGPNVRSRWTISQGREGNDLWSCRALLTPLSPCHCELERAER